MMIVLFACDYSTASPLDDKLAGTNLPDFTLVYRIARQHKLQGISPQQISALVGQSIDEINRRTKKNLPSGIKDDKIDEITHDLERIAHGDQDVLVISNHGNKLLVKEFMPTKKETGIFVYDGARSLYRIGNDDAQIWSGFQYLHLVDFVFPGCGVSGIPLCREMAAVPGGEGKYSGMVAMDDGIPDRDGLPYYWPGEIKTQNIGGLECVTEMHGGNPGQYEQQCLYLEYRTIAPGISFPMKMRLVESYKAGSVLPFSNYYTAEYTLQKALPQALPESDFTFETQLKGITIVQDNSKKQPVGIRYVPGKPLETQFEEDRKRREKSLLAQVPSSGGRKRTGVIGLLALLSALGGWYFYRRTQALRGKSRA